MLRLLLAFGSLIYSHVRVRDIPVQILSTLRTVVKNRQFCRQVPASGGRVRLEGLTPPVPKGHVRSRPYGVHPTLSGMLFSVTFRVGTPPGPGFRPPRQAFLMPLQSTYKLERWLDCPWMTQASHPRAGTRCAIIFSPWRFHLLPDGALLPSVTTEAFHAVASPPFCVSFLPYYRSR